MTKEYVDLLVIIPLEEELHEFTEVFSHKVDVSTDTQFRWMFESGVEDISMLVVQQEEMGRSSAAKATYSLLEVYDVGLVVCLGIAGSLDKDAKLGYVCYTGHVIDVYDNAKASDVADGVKIEFSPRSYKTLREITQSLNFFRTQPSLKPAYKAWQEARGAVARELITTPVASLKPGATETVEMPEAKDGTVVCAMVSNAKNYNDRLKALDRKVVAIDTESGSVFAQCEDRHINALTIRGISDYAKNKGDLEDESGGTVRAVAAGNAASFLALALTNDRFLSHLRKYRSQLSMDLPVIGQAAATPVTCLEDVLADLEKFISERLNELSPEFRLQEKGYRLPIPRVRAIDEGSAMGDSSKPEPIEIRTVLSIHQNLIFSLPKTYPDQSLSWAIANDLLTAEIDGKQVIPLVIDGEKLRPPSNGFWARSPIPKEAINRVEGIQVVFIIDNPPVGSKTRSKFIREQIAENPSAKFLFLEKSGTSVLREGEFMLLNGLAGFAICDISFVQIAHFVQRNFSMSGSEAEVIAYRLRQTFQQFELSTHPTYFAGIPRETLAALLQANRRSELIQLAVDGFLTFVVADDTADVNLSRTTRKRFLRRLAAELRYQKRSFDHEALIAFTADFARYHDFKIDPIRFIQSFVDKGLLHFDGGSVRISLPFIESYLLAEELAADGSSAETYFSAIHDTSFDISAFDIYCELGPSTSIVDAIISDLESQASSLDLTTTHVLLGSEINPAILAHPQRANVMQQRVQNAIVAVRENRDESQDKQRLLDAGDRVREETFRKSEVIEQDEATREKARSVNELSIAWVIGCTLLGSGAEHLEASIKRRLSLALVATASKIMDDWTRLNMTVDFKSVKENLQDENSAASSHLLSLGFTKADAKQLIDILVDLFEFKSLADPMLRILYHLCETARHRVLSVSVESVKPRTPMEGIIHSTWWTDIEPGAGRGSLKEAIKALPTAAFLRSSLVTHYLTRAYWTHPKPEDRLVLLDAADDLVKNTGKAIDKGKLKRLFSSDVSEEDPLDRPTAEDAA